MRALRSLPLSRSLSLVLVLVLVLALLSLSACSSSPPPPPRKPRLEQQPGQAPVVDPLSRRELTFGAVVGYFGEHTSHVWRGIPYARPPIGALRWRAPRPVEPWEDVRQALESGLPCAQPAAEPDGSAGVLGQEDCLYLDLYAPAMNENLALSRRLPVMVWIHGGANIAGSASAIDAGRLALQRQVLVVVPNYRLGPLGWFSHPALAHEAAPAEQPAQGTAPYRTPQQIASQELAADDRSGNYGTLDLIATLRFIRENIARFGGDPDQVTLVGQEAGAADVLSLLLSPRANGLFERAIAESPLLYSTTVDDARASSAEVLSRLLIAAGRAADREQARTVAAAMDRSATEAFLRAQTPAALLAAAIVTRASGDDRPPEYPTVIRDGEVIGAADPLERFARGDYHRVPIILGSNRDEMKLFQSRNPELVERTAAGAARIADPARYALLAEYRSAAWRNGVVHRLASALSEAKDQAENVFVYRFDWDEEPSSPELDGKLLLGAAHGIEQAFVLGVFEADRQGLLYGDVNARGRARLSRAMMAYWSELAYEGSPGAGRADDLAEWEPWGEARNALVLDTQAGGDIRIERGQEGIAAMLARLAGDERAPEPIAKCRVLFWLTQRSYGMSPAEYDQATPRIDCSAYPPERYPW